tara:strand:+ start:1111 stop:1800 length:690 start_codon:yes stop_codon:yes gene_type:complete
MIKSKKIDVVLLCGGKGQRLRPHTLSTPKPLLLVNKKPFLYYMISKFLKLNVDQIIVATGYKSFKVAKFLNKYFKKNKKIKLVNSGNVDIIKRLKDCSKYIKNDFFVCYGDTYVSINLNNYIKEFQNKKKYAFVVGTYYKIKYGTVTYNKKTKIIKKFKEKPTIQDPINLGYFLFKKKLMNNIKKNNSWVKFLENLSKSKKLFINITDKKYFTFDSPRDYHEIKTRFTM